MRPRACRRSASCRRRPGRESGCAFSRSASLYFSSCARSGPWIMYWMAPPPPPGPPPTRTAVRRPGSAWAGRTCRAPRPSPRTDRGSRLSSACRRTSTFAVFSVPAASPATVTSVNSTSGISRIAVGEAVGEHLRRRQAGAFRRAQRHLELRLVVFRREVDGRDPEQRHARQQHQHRAERDEAAVRHRPAQHRGVDAIERIEEPAVARVRARRPSPAPSASTPTSSASA